MNEFDNIKELLLEKERNQQKWNHELDKKNKELCRVYLYRVFICIQLFLKSLPLLFYFKGNHKFKYAIDTNGKSFGE